MGGRVKTLHPKLYGGLLALRDDEEHMAAAAEHEVEFVDLVCVNLYPFEATARRRGATEHEVIENIDIGGPTMIRAAAKNYAFAAVVVNPASYDAILQELADTDGKLSLGTRESLAAEAFSYTARYDSAISRWFVERQDDFPPLLLNAFEKITDLSYGENPHQRAAYYAQAGARMHVLSQVRQLGGKDLSFNNVLDLNAGRLLVQEFELPACAIIKHNNPCGVAVGGSVLEAYQAAFACDPMSAFGGVICVNRTVEQHFAEALLQQFCEVLIAPEITEEALELLSGKPNMRVLEDGERRRLNIAERDLKRVMGGLLVQDRDLGLEDRTEMEVVSERKPTEAEWGEMLFAWKVCKHVRSNAIVLSNDLASVGIGAGQMSRVDSVRLAIEKAHAAGSSLLGAALASDAYFPFPDGPQLAIDTGVQAIIQPGGSIRDHEVVEAADAAGIAMVFTHRRHFRH
jgi:phosphoribosylaminoimidazolecarboxamide formyltransferase/IMP cyclohydrolase